MLADTEIQITGRTDLADYFRQVLGSKKWSIMPVLAFVRQDDGTSMVQVVVSQEALLALPDNVRCMGHWTGRWSTDYFQFSVGMFREHCQQYAASLASLQRQTRP